MAQVNPTRGLPGSDLQGAGDTKEVNALTTLLNEFNGNTDAANLKTAVKDRLGLSDGTTNRSGKAIIATTETRSNVAYGTLTTPDQVSVTLPTDGVIRVRYHATWQCTSNNAAWAAVFLGANQLKDFGAGAVGSPAVQEAQLSGTVANNDIVLQTAVDGLARSTGTSPYGGDVTTGQVAHNGVLEIDAAAGTYVVSIQFKTLVGQTVTVKNRKLRVEAVAF